MKKIMIFILLILGTAEGWASSQILLLREKNEKAAFVLQIRIDPPETIDRVFLDNGNTTKETVFKTDISTDIYLLIDTSIPMKHAFKKGIRPLIEQMEHNKKNMKTGSSPLSTAK